MFDIFRICALVRDTRLPDRGSRSLFVDYELQKRYSYAQIYLWTCEKKANAWNTICTGRTKKQHGYRHGVCLNAYDDNDNISERGKTKAFWLLSWSFLVRERLIAIITIYNVDGAAPLNYHPLVSRHAPNGINTIVPKVYGPTVII